VWVDQLGTPEGDYRKFVQLIEWDDGGEDEVRFGYYVKDSHKGEEDWRFGGQNTFTLPTGLARKLIQKAMESGIL